MSRRPLTEKDVRRILQASVDAAGGQRAWAAKVGVSQGYVSKILLGRRPPGVCALDMLGLRELPRTYAPVEGES